MKLSEMARAALRERLVKARAVRMANIAAKKTKEGAQKVEAISEDVEQATGGNDVQFVVAYTIVPKPRGNFSLRRYSIPASYTHYTEEPDDLWGVEMGKLIMALEGLR